jgi:hypothetical protein
MKKATILIIFFISLSSFASISDEEKKILNQVQTASAWFWARHVAKQVTENNEGGGKFSITPGSEEEDKFVEFIIEHFKDLDLAPSVESFPVRSYLFKETILKIGKQKIPIVLYGQSIGTYGLLDGKWYSLSNTKDKKSIVANIIDVGLGTFADFSKHSDIANKIILVERSDKKILPSAVIEEAKKRRVKAIIFYGYLERNSVLDAIKQDSIYSEIPVFGISLNSANIIQRKIADGIKDIFIEARVDIQENDESKNIILYFIGKELPEEYIVIGTHYDRFFASYSDTSSGIGSILELARFLKSYENSRTIVLVLFGASKGGEKGLIPNRLLGSFDFVSKHKEVIKNLVCYIDLSSIGARRAGRAIASSYELSAFTNNIILDLGLGTLLEVHNGTNRVYDAYSFLSSGGSFLEPIFNDYQFSVFDTDKDTDVELDQNNLSSELKAIVLAMIRLDKVSILPFDLSSLIGKLIDVLIHHNYVESGEKIKNLVAKTNALTLELKQLEDELLKKRTNNDLSLKGQKFERRKNIYNALSPINSFLMNLRKEIVLELFVLNDSVNNLKPNIITSDLVIDLDNIQKAIASLEIGNDKQARNFLVEVSYLVWGQYISEDIYLDIIKELSRKKNDISIDPKIFSVLTRLTVDLKPTTYEYEITTLKEVRDKLVQSITKRLNKINREIDNWQKRLKKFKTENKF